MALFYFHTQTDTRFTDIDGVECVDRKAARLEAIRTCGEMVKDSPAGFWGSRPWSVTVTDVRGLVLYEIQMDGFTSPATQGEA